MSRTRFGPLADLRAEGFDQCSPIPHTKRIRIRCSQCEVVVINGIATHEQGCPNAVHECVGCDMLIPMK